MQGAGTAGRRRGGSTLSATIIAKNEEDRIEGCLRSLAGWADEIVVVDSGSEDRTVEICRRYTPRVIETCWRGYGRQKQYAAAEAGGDWVLSIDADEVVTPALREEIDGLLSRDPEQAAFRVGREYRVFGRDLRHGDCGRAPVRLYRRGRARFSDAEVHEKLIVDGPVGKLRSRLIHHSIRDMAHALEKSNEYALLWAAQQRLRGRRTGLLQAFAHAAWCFFEVTVLRRGCVDGRRGLVVAAIAAQYTFNKYAALWAAGLSDPRAGKEASSARVAAVRQAAPRGEDDAVGTLGPRAAGTAAAVRSIRE